MTKTFYNAVRAAQDAIPGTYDMKVNDLSDLISLAYSDERDKIYKAIKLAFEFGFVMGNRATLSRKLKRL